MLLIFVGLVLGLALAGLAVFAAICIAIRNDDRKGLPPRAPGLTARLTRRIVGMSGSGSARSRNPDRESQLVGSGAGQYNHSSRQER
ncbi:MAG: hypothetical protein ACRDOK_19745 [Streptosporangiaceae bacterium]